MKEEEKRLNFILKMYESIWNTARNKERITVQCLGIIASAVGIVALSLYHCKEYLALAVFTAQIVLMWGILLAIEASYEYRRLQGLAIRIEKEMVGKPIYNILPREYHNLNKDFPEIYKIHLITLFIFFVFIAVLYLFQESYTLREILKFLPIVGLMGIFFPVCHYYQRQNRLSEDFYELVKKK